MRKEAERESERGERARGGESECGSKAGEERGRERERERKREQKGIHPTRIERRVCVRRACAGVARSVGRSVVHTKAKNIPSRMDRALRKKLEKRKKTRAVGRSRTRMHAWTATRIPVHTQHPIQSEREIHGHDEKEKKIRYRRSRAQGESDGGGRAWGAGPREVKPLSGMWRFSPRGVKVFSSDCRRFW